jgi:serine kinase of HPr protein (carbohydrate metabolism regulator)
MLQIHATCVAIGDDAVLLCGPSGSGKSDLALRLIDGGARLVADDRVILTRQESGMLIASAPRELRDLLEVRGIGILRLDALASTKVRLVVDLVSPGDVERQPADCQADFLGVRRPLRRLAPFEVSTAAKIRLALQYPAVTRLPVA